MEQEIYGGRYKVKMTKGHRYYISRKIKDKWGPWEAKTGVTTYGGIKDKSTPLKYWVAKIMHKFLGEVLDSRSITKYDLDEAKDLHRKRLEEAGTIGSKIHDWIESYCKGEQPGMPEEDDVLLGVTAFIDWVKENKVQFVESEMYLYSEKHDYCGMVDAVAKIKGSQKLYIIDYKTSNGLYNDVMLQTAAYASAYKEMTKRNVVGRWAIRLEKRSREQFKEEMDEKGLPNAEYVPFEAIYLDGDVEEKKEGRKTLVVSTGKHNPDLMFHDFEAWLHAKGLFTWNKGSEKRMEAYKE